MKCKECGSDTFRAYSVVCDNVRFDSAGNTIYTDEVERWEDDTNPMECAKCWTKVGEEE